MCNYFVSTCWHLLDFREHTIFRDLLLSSSQKSQCLLTLELHVYGDHCHLSPASLYMCTFCIGILLMLLSVYCSHVDIVGCVLAAIPQDLGRTRKIVSYT